VARQLKSHGCHRPQGVEGRLLACCEGQHISDASRALLFLKEEVNTRGVRA
jgi:hypothetical protein